MGFGLGVRTGGVMRDIGSREPVEVREISELGSDPRHESGKRFGSSTGPRGTDLRACRTREWEQKRDARRAHGRGAECSTELATVGRAAQMRSHARCAIR